MPPSAQSTMMDWPLPSCVMGMEASVTSVVTLGLAWLRRLFAILSKPSWRMWIRACSLVSHLQQRRPLPQKKSSRNRNLLIKHSVNYSPPSSINGIRRLLSMQPILLLANGNKSMCLRNTSMS